MSQTPPTPAGTPRTDAAIYEEGTGYNGMVKVVSPDFARQLERELATATADLATANARVKELEAVLKEIADSEISYSGESEVAISAVRIARAAIKSL